MSSDKNSTDSQQAPKNPDVLPPAESEPGSSEKEDQEEDSQEVHIVEAQYRGPLPPPKMLGAFEKEFPGTAKHILEQSVEEQKHRHRIESRALDLAAEDTKHTRWVSLSALLAVLAAVVLISIFGTVPAAVWSILVLVGIPWVVRLARPLLARFGGGGSSNDSGDPA